MFCKSKNPCSKKLKIMIKQRVLLSSFFTLEFIGSILPNSHSHPISWALLATLTDKETNKFPTHSYGQYLHPNTPVQNLYKVSWFSSIISIIGAKNKLYLQPWSLDTVCSCFVILKVKELPSRAWSCKAYQLDCDCKSIKLTELFKENFKNYF